MIKNAVTSKTKAIMIAHTLWNAFDLDAIQSICKDHKLWLIEDNCDALWTTYNGKYTWTFGDIGTQSFYPAHHITMWEWWVVMTKHPHLAKIIRSYRDRWRDCRCPTWKDNTCCMRFKRQLWELPKGFDHKYIYSRIWYNLKITDMQAALWVAQLQKLPQFIQARKDNFIYLKNKCIEHWLDKYFILPEATKNTDPSWFWFVLTLKESVWITREDIIQYLIEHKIGTRLLFAGNYLKHPWFINYVSEDQYRIVWELTNTDIIMHNSFRVWVYPGLHKEQLDYIIFIIKEYLGSR
jgi:CDP-6-deoxy-D-xylo-4-hexulose-3-dehydrase